MLNVNTNTVSNPVCLMADCTHKDENLHHTLLFHVPLMTLVLHEADTAQL